MSTKIKIPFEGDQLKTLKSGDRVLLTGTVYTARDAAHKRMTEQVEDGGSLPFDVKDQVDRKSVV